VAKITALAKELGWRRALLISGFAVALALLASGVIHQVIGF
jgi:Fe2+ transport system protein B